MEGDVRLLVGYGAMLGQRSMRLATVYSVVDLRETGLTGVERRTFHVGMR